VTYGTNENDLNLVEDNAMLKLWGTNSPPESSEGNEIWDIIQAKGNGERSTTHGGGEARTHMDNHLTEKGLKWHGTQVLN